MNCSNIQIHQYFTTRTPAMESCLWNIFTTKHYSIFQNSYHYSFIPTFTNSQAEERFWTQLIDKYLKPLNADKTKAEVEKATEELGEELAELRDKVVFGFFLIDILLIVTIMGMSLTIEQVGIIRKGFYISLRFDNQGLPAKLFLRRMFCCKF